MLKLTLLLFIVVTAMKQSKAQKQGKELLDSLKLELPKAKEDSNKVKLLNSLAWTSTNAGESDHAQGYANEALVLSQKIGFKNGEAAAYNNFGMFYARKSNYAEALKNYDASLKIREATGNKKGMAGVYNNIGLIFGYQGKTAEALNMYLKALRINEAIHNTDWITINYNNIGNIYTDLRNYPEALKNHMAAFKIYQQNGDKEGLHHSYNNIGIIYQLQGNFPEALKNSFASLKLRQELGDKYEVSASLNNIGTIYNDQHKFAEALEYYFASLKIAQEDENKIGIATAYNNIGEVKTTLKNFAEAKDYLGKSLLLYKEAGNIDGLKNIYERLIKLDSATGNYESALQNYKMYSIYKDSLLNEDMSKKIVEGQMQYDFDKKEAVTKAVQAKKDELTVAVLNRQKILRNGFIGGFAVMLLFAGIFFTQRNKIKKEKTRSDELLLNILPAETAEELKSTGTAAAKDFDEVTVLFTDFKDFTQASEKMLAHEVVNEIHFYFSEFDRIVSKYNIEKIKTIGDSYMAAGGLPVANKTNPADAVNAALEIQSFMRRIKEERKEEDKQFFEIRIGVHTGPVVAGIVGIKKFAYDIWGDTVNVASRMESSCEEGKVNISGATYDLVKSGFKCTYRGKIQAKHKGEIDMYFVEAQTLLSC